MTALTLSTDLPQAIQALLALKGSRDNISFTPYKLAKAINVDRSLIQRILKGEVESPRIDTLMKIAQFFANDGFSVTLDDLLNWKTNVVDVREQILTQDSPKTLMLYSMEKFAGEPIGSTSVMLSNCSPSTLAVFSSKYLKPIFTPGCIFVIDMLMQPKHEQLVMIRNGKSQELALKKIYFNENNTTLYSFDTDTSIVFEDASSIKIIGAVIHVTIKT